MLSWVSPFKQTSKWEHDGGGGKNTGWSLMNEKKLRCGYRHIPTCRTEKRQTMRITNVGHLIWYKKIHSIELVLKAGAQKARLVLCSSAPARRQVRSAIRRRWSWLLLLPIRQRTTFLCNVWWLKKERNNQSSCAQIILQSNIPLFSWNVHAASLDSMCLWEWPTVVMVSTVRFAVRLFQRIVRAKSKVIPNSSVASLLRE